MADTPRDPTEEEHARTRSSCEMGGCDNFGDNFGVMLAWDEDGDRYLPCCAVCMVTLKPKFATRRFVVPTSQPI